MDSTPAIPSAADPGPPPAIAPGTGGAAPAWTPGTEVGVIEGCTGRRMHGCVALVDAGAVLVWIADLRHTPPNPCIPHGYLIPMSTERIASGAMWAEPLPTALTVAEPTIEDVADYWVWARNVGAAAITSANSYVSALRAVFAGQGAGMATAVADVDLEADLAAFAARRGRSTKTRRQYTASARSAVRNYRVQPQNALAAAQVGVPVWAGAGGCRCLSAAELAQ